MISLARARSCINRFHPLGPVTVSSDKALGLFCGSDIAAEADCPSIASSLKDGFAVHSADIVHASRNHPVQLALVGTVTAGGQSTARVRAGQTIRIMTGAPIPEGTDAVLASEFASQEGTTVHAFADAHPGRNILDRGSDVAVGDTILARGTRLFPAHLGLLAAAGVTRVAVYKKPKVIIVATGSELVAPDERITPGKIAASNLATLLAEAQSLGLEADWLLIRDNLSQLQKTVAPLIGSYDVILTCGGVLDGDKDFTVRAMEELGVEPIFHRVRVGPGKGVCLGTKDNSSIFNLPGGPPSNHVAYLLLAKAGILRLCGAMDPFADYLMARLNESLPGQQGWTQVFYGNLDRDGERRTVTPLIGCSRLQAMAEADCLIEIPEEYPGADAGTIQKIWKIR
ncbi:MAG TPA: molybdopterin molybdenumtransferase MoeA [Desulfobulbaceae bacterium]|nr:molybdopterin molybdenumtransferase MoeA [Desulfobulbaceae bacterium]